MSQSQNKAIRVLSVEDSEQDVALLTRHLHAAGYEPVVERVETVKTMKAALKAREWDIILCDYTMPAFDALKALEVLHQSELDIPFIIISGTVGEEVAVTAMLAGADDYIPKNNLTRLVPAIKRELQEASNRRGHREAEEARVISEERYHTLFEYAPDGIIIASPESYYLDANASMCQMLGYARGELLGMHASDIVTEAERPHINEALGEIQAEFEHHREWRFRRKDGSEFDGDVTVTEMPDGNLLALIRDISEQKLASEALSDFAREKAESLALINTILSRAPIGFAYHDRELRYVRINETLAAMNGQSVERHMGRTLSEMVPETAPVLEPIMRKVIEEGEPVVDLELSGETQAEPGQAKHWLVSFYPVQTEGGEVLGVGVLVSEATERKKAEEELQRQKTELRVLFDVMPAMVWFKDTDNNILRVNKRVAEEAGRTVEEIEGKPAHEIYPDEAAKVYDDDLKVLKSGQPKLGHVEMLSGADGGKRWVQTDKVPYFDEEGKPIGIVVMAQDVTKRRNAEYALRRAEGKYRSIFENSSEGIFQNTPDGQLISANPALARILGFHSPEELIRERTNVAHQSYEDPEVREQISRGLESEGGVDGVEYELRRKDGSLIWVSENTRVIRDDTGQVVYYEGSLVDITESRKAEKALRESEERYRELVENALDIIYTHDLDGNYTSINKAAETITGYTNAEVLGMNMAATVPPEQLEKARQMIAAKLGGVETTSYELELIAKDGHCVPVDVNTRIIYENGIPVGVQGIARDITERKRAESEVESTMERLNAAQRLGRIGDWEWNFATGSITWSHEVFEITGRDPALGPPANYEDMASSYEPPSIVMLGERVAAVLESGEAQEYELVVLRPDGERVFVQAVAEPKKDEDGQIIALGGTIQDISSRKRAESALADSETRYRSLFENMLEGYAYCTTIFENDKLQDFVYMEVNGAFETLTGLKDVVGRKVSDVVPGLAKFNPEIFEIYGRVALTGQPERFEAYVEPLKSWLSVTVYSSDPEKFVAVFDNITERKHAEERVRKSEANLAKSQEIAHLGSWELDLVAGRDIQEGDLRWSDEVFRIFGYEPGEIEVSNERFFGSVHPDDRSAVAAAVAEAIREGSEYRLDHRIVLPNGKERYVYEHGEIMSDVNGLPLRIVGTVQDITDQRQLEEQYRQSQKMEAVGVLAGGIAHDFNNLLTAINGYSDLTLKKMAAGDPLRQNIEEVKSAGTRAAELTSQLLAFSRKQVLRPTVLNLNTVISNIERMLRRIIKESIELCVVLDPDLGNIKADAGQIEQVIMNLAINARDAMPGGGMLSVETKNVQLDEDYISQHLAVKPGDFIRLTVTDTGEGIDAATKPHIFEPFFTTKEVGMGTGLGLSTVYGIVKQSGGDLMVHSEPAHGATFEIYLPCVDESVKKPRWTGDHGIKYSGTETILVAEDEEIVRTLVREILTDHGYMVLEAPGGEEALDICSSYTEPIHMLLTDVIMPKMGGSELKAKVVDMLPDIKVLFMSGYTDDSLAHRSITETDIAFIEKPFTPDALARKLREVLES